MLVNLRIRISTDFYNNQSQGTILIHISIN